MLGCEQVPLDFQEYASEQAEVADMLADNHLAELAEIDEERLVAVLKELQAADHNVALAGWLASARMKWLGSPISMRIPPTRRRFPTWNFRRSSSTTT